MNGPITNNVTYRFESAALTTDNPNGTVEAFETGIFFGRDLEEDDTKLSHSRFAQLTCLAVWISAIPKKILYCSDVHYIVSIL